jgi:hypothetical protein
MSDGDLWKVAGVPHKGWECVNVIDLKPNEWSSYTPGNCKMCGNESLRYVHIMEHPHYPDSVDAGCVCAEKMCEGYDGKHRERRLANRASRKSRWLSRDWRESEKGNEYLNIEGCNVGIYPDRYRPGKWRWWLKYDETFAPCKHSFDTREAAKLALFNALADKLDW